MPPNSGRQVRLEEVQFLLQAFRWERFVHLFFASSAVALLLVCAARIIVSGSSQISEISGIFGSSGLLAYAMSRVVYMFNRALEHLARGGNR